MTLFLYNIASGTSTEEMISILSLVGKIDRISYSSGQKFGFVDFVPEVDEDKALSMLKGYPLKEGRRLGADKARVSFRESKKHKYKTVSYGPEGYKMDSNPSFSGYSVGSPNYSGQFSPHSSQMGPDPRYPGSTFRPMSMHEIIDSLHYMTPIDRQTVSRELLSMISRDSTREISKPPHLSPEGYPQPHPHAQQPLYDPRGVPRYSSLPPSAHEGTFHGGQVVYDHKPDQSTRYMPPSTSYDMSHAQHYVQSPPLNPPTQPGSISSLSGGKSGSTSATGTSQGILPSGKPTNPKKSTQSSPHDPFFSPFLDESSPSYVATGSTSSLMSTSSSNSASIQSNPSSDVGLPLSSHTMYSSSLSASRSSTALATTLSVSSASSPGGSSTSRDVGPSFHAIDNPASMPNYMAGMPETSYSSMMGHKQAPVNPPHPQRPLLSVTSADSVPDSSSSQESTSAHALHSGL
ncbi:hypothetical protein ADUPG1_009520 [Aduncisulcus paluster]|uniref:RRM domain-containing protein n=1 Tax=Aduncisulcus paluster TaxID=2918883 RepID=A0ABQ5KVW4_9EUKA|nr:hypothetical protein ADUPG1_009520 [Aduncisulcus paluster]|eukprot:gnl/Carplike_NY0171/1683_a2271_716.p1 GENE.gnl/Carplike_NY0171/1683_a2271_716~~gnl/Carplike_NY0171/1683_a2271_716.p1  ORF type:complete len:462 (+),score=85.71 gnl/Carplike_NY0171/1683_a2271_716:84-1469(+)